MSQLKYTFVTGDTIIKEGRTLTRIKALRAFGDVAKDELGGYIQQGLNLDNRIKDENNEDLDCWVYSDGLVTPTVFGSVYDRAQVLENGKIKGNAEICDNFIVSGTGIIQGSSLGLENGLIVGGVCEDNAIMVGDTEMAPGGILRDRARMSRFSKLYGTGIVQGAVEISNNERIFDQTVG